MRGVSERGEPSIAGIVALWVACEGDGALSDRARLPAPESCVPRPVRPCARRGGR